MAESNSPFGPIPDGDDDFVNTLEGLLRRLRERARRKKSSDLTSTLENVHNLNLQEGPPIHAKETNIPPSTEGGVGRLWTEDFLFEHLEFLHAHSPIAVRMTLRPVVSSTPSCIWLWISSTRVRIGRLASPSPTRR
ncbi:hypothetical protein CC2G_008241 [Coprinopsis cinerea AmutBmut pab1-1]|nr:hypothetical protein CC2G_008241 [Coprinopsis cinerea AmutBmut pab1-1]